MQAVMDMLVSQEQEILKLRRQRDALREALDKYRESLGRCLYEAEGWLNDSRGVKPQDIIGYDGWAEKARALLVMPPSKP